MTLMMAGERYGVTAAMTMRYVRIQTNRVACANEPIRVPSRSVMLTWQLKVSALHFSRHRMCSFGDTQAQP